MSPALTAGDIVLVVRRRPRVGDMVLALAEGREVVKRVETIKYGTYYIVGDNRDASTDSRHYGPVKRSAILGTVMIGFPTAVAPPDLVRPYAVWLGRVAAVLLVCMVVIHLFRIDTFLPTLDAALPSGSGFATFVGLLVILSELFAVPFALRMRLSPLAQALSGALLVFAPLWWVAICIVTVDVAENTGQFGEFFMTASTPALLGINMIWVFFNATALYLMGYNRLKPAHLLRK